MAGHERAPYAPKMPATKQMLERYSRHIEELLEKQGKPVKVLGKLTPEPGADLAVIFRPASLPSVAEVYFKGTSRSIRRSSSEPSPAPPSGPSTPSAVSARSSTPA